MANNKFKPIVTDNLGAEAQLQTHCSGGISERRARS